MVERYYNENGELGVLISIHLGSGWSTLNQKELAYDKRIIEYWLNEKPSEDDMANYIESLGYRKPLMYGYKTLVLEYVPAGTMFCVHQYEGFESVQTPETMGMIIA